MYTRREVVQQGGRLGLGVIMTAVGLLPPGPMTAEAWDQTAFAGKTLTDVFQALGATGATPTDQIIITAPDIAENGAVVPISVLSTLQHTQSIALLIEKNAQMLAANFSLPAGTLPELRTRVKMAQSSDVYVLVKAADTFVFAKKAVEVIIGGCDIE